MNINWTSVTQQEFLDDYWQKKPIVLKGAIPSFADPIDANELAGLAMEEVVESRIVSSVNDKWNVKHGPFADFDDLPESNWSLLVQGVDRWVPDIFELRSLVAFLPKWRVDDVMVSYSTEGGGVGAHLDQYDVFIIQGEGRRQWQVGEVDASIQQKEVVQDLQQVDSFSPLIDQVLEPGDILYIPPFAPHCGNTIEASLSYSIGFRAPSQTELLTSFADFVFENELGKKRFNVSDTVAAKTTNSGLPSETINNLKSFMLESLENNQFDEFLHQFLTEPTRELDIVASEPQWTEEQISQLVNSGNIEIQKVLGLQTSYFEDAKQCHFYCNGTYFKLALLQNNFAKQLHESQSLTSSELKTPLSKLENITLLTTLINTGYFYIDE